MSSREHDADPVVLRDAMFRYRSAELPALQHIDLVIPWGQLTAILGPTNAGKTTLCLMLAGLVPHQLPGEFSGSVVVAGEDSAELGQEKIAQLTRHVGSVFQNPESQLFGLTVEEDVAFGQENLMVAAAQIRSTTAEVLAVVGLGGFEKRSPYRLSGGQKQRVAIAAALALHPQVLALDEPISELDPIGKAEVLEVVRALKDEGSATIVVADHDAEWVLEIADRVVILAAGSIVASGTPAEVFADPDAILAHGLHLPDALALTHYLTRAGALPAASTTEASATHALQSALRDGRLVAGSPPAARAARATHSGAPAIEVRGLSFGYPGSAQVLHELDLVIPANDYIALVGHNGSGKTTLAKHFNGILAPSSGTVLLNGALLKGTAAGVGLSAAARTVGYVYQNPDHQIFARTVFDEVAFGPRNLGVSGDELSRVVTDALEFVGLAGDEKKEPFFLGLGQRQRLAVASVLAMQPAVLVVDEPDTGQDAAGAAEMMHLVDRLHDAGRTIVMITHSMELVARHAHRVVAMADGRIVADSPTREFFASAETLAGLSLRAPQVTRICAALGSASPILTVEEAIDWLIPGRQGT
ncbi:MAG: transporter [Microbacteriaceae bacterium]|nr:transporter [Microbacteriaceae bacterium]